MNFKITFIDGEMYELDFDKALELVMKMLCKDNNWDAGSSIIDITKRRLTQNPDDLIDDLRYVPFASVIDFLEPCPFVDSFLETQEMELFWVDPTLTKIVLQAESTLEVYGY